MDQNKIQQMQFLEQNLQNMGMQKQALSMELSENNSAIEAVKNSKDKIYKVIGQLMLVQEKEKTIEELEHKKKLIESRIEAFAKQEEAMQNQLQSLRDENSSVKN